jgi:hypothetical protein
MTLIFPLASISTRETESPAFIAPRAAREICAVVKVAARRVMPVSPFRRGA